MPVCMVLVELAITCVHDYMVVTVTVAKIYGKMNFNSRALAITAVPTTLTSRFPTTGYARMLLYHMYKARARRNGYRMFISVYILWIRLIELTEQVDIYRYYSKVMDNILINPKS